ncbi:hypothetical protein [Sphingomonas aerophila]|uniref:Uncharacterized protein n=1 Tax=Sphingomonas aerophila TaxID=1344948 RepID=A0A7W9BBI1_9SPHN|nr:hypothetical protein [Sphingomonas aerophila]MBB5714180.1 hypothetical protein [Sphingomonas aerophila]
MKFFVAAIFAISSMSSSVQAQKIEKAQPQPKPTKSAKKICKSSNSTGSRVPASVCHTQAEWDAIEQQGDFSLAQQKFQIIGNK